MEQSVNLMVLNHTSNQHYGSGRIRPQRSIPNNSRGRVSSGLSSTFSLFPQVRINLHKILPLLVAACLESIEIVT
jgi:hypothetical protein